jgi:hypothetical protein
MGGNRKRAPRHAALDLIYPVSIAEKELGWHVNAKEHLWDIHVRDGRYFR